MEKIPHWRTGDRVATPSGYVADIVSLHERRALVRYLGKHHGLAEIELQVSLLRPATAHDLLLAGISRMGSRSDMDMCPSYHLALRGAPRGNR